MLHSLIALPPEITLNLYHHKVTETRTRHVNVLHVYNPHPVSTGDPGEAEEDCRHMLISESTKQSRPCAPDRHISPADIGQKRQKIGVTMGSGNNSRHCLSALHASLADTADDGHSAVRVDFDGRYVLINTAEGRQKDKNPQRDGRVAMSITDPNNAYCYLEVRGRLAERPA
jgi:hypothetical protein